MCRRDEPALPRSSVLVPLLRRPEEGLQISSPRDTHHRVHDRRGARRIARSIQSFGEIRAGDEIRRRHVDRCSIDPLASRDRGVLSAEHCVPQRARPLNVEPSHRRAQVTVLWPYDARHHLVRETLGDNVRRETEWPSDYWRREIKRTIGKGITDETKDQ